MPTRRTFLVATAATAALSRSAAGANERIRFAIIGSGGRGSHMGTVMANEDDTQCVAVCDVYKPTRDKVAASLADKPEAIEDYRRVLERDDIDAVLIATPDHWHGPMVVEASEAGKDSYCEKPASVSIEDGMKMREAVRKHSRVCQIGLQQRSWEHFQENAKRVQSGMFGDIYLVHCVYRGNYTRVPAPDADPPEDLNWELFQGPAERRPFNPGRQRGWRAYYDYSGGTLTDWGTHLTDISHWYMNATEPITCSGSGQYAQTDPPQPDMLPDTVAVTWKYEKFVMSYTNTVMVDPTYDVQGNYFLGPKGWLQVNRTGYRYFPTPQRGFGRATPPPAPEFEAFSTAFPYVGGPADQAHIRNFLDCVKSREDPVCDVDTGFYSTLPTLMGVLAVRNGRTYAWDGQKATPV